MAVVPADESHYDGIKELLLAGRHVYTQPAFDLADNLKQQNCVVGIDGLQIWGFACLQSEARPTTFHESAPSRVYLSTLVLANRRSPYADVPILIDALITQVDWQWRQNRVGMAQQNLIQLIYYGHQHWLIKPLEQAGFMVTERVETLVLDRLQRRELPTFNLSHNYSAYIMKLAQRADLQAIADLDVDAFSSLWHLGVGQLLELWSSDHRLYVACNEEEIIGYTAVAQIHEENYGGERYAHLSRIATKTAHQGRGVGKKLLLEVLEFAQRQGLQMVTLNTQTDNEPSHALYRSMGFSKSGHVYPVLTKLFKFVV